MPVNSGRRLLPPDLGRLLVVDLGFLGDTLHLLPALAELRRQHPRASLQVVTTPLGAEVLRLAPWADRVWEYPLGDPSPPWWRHLGLQWSLARERFPAAFNFSGADRTLFVTAAAGIPLRVTRQPNRDSWWRRRLAGHVLPPPPRHVPVYEQRRQLLASAGYELGPVQFGLRVPEDARRWAANEVPGVTLHLSINASSPFKEWPMARWVELARVLLEDPQVSLVATGSSRKREQERLADLELRVANPRLRVVRSPLSLARLAALVERCRAHVGTDSGVTHLAVAVGTPTVSVFRDYAGLSEWRPGGPRDRAVVRPCRCVDRPALDPACATSGTAACLQDIPASAVAALVREVLSVGTVTSGGGRAGASPSQRPP